MDNRTNLVGRTSAEITELIAPHVDRDFRGRQVAQWIIDRNASSFSEMTNLSLALQVIESSDGSRKFLFGLSDGVGVEGVSMREGAKATFCLSSQAGCAVGCTFCVTGAIGAGRNLRPGEIVSQYRAMLRHLDAEVERVSVQLSRSCPSA